MASTQIIEADDKKTIGIDGLAWPDAGIPPAWFAIIYGVIAGGMMVSAQSMAYEHSVAVISVEFAISLHNQIIARQCLFARQLYGCFKMVCLWGDYPYRIHRYGIRHRRGRFLVRSVSDSFAGWGKNLYQQSSLKAGRHGCNRQAVWWLGG